MNSPRAQRALNSSRRIKEYSRPFTSPGRGARVVYETDKWSCRSFWSRALTSVDLPAPEGATMMNTLPVMLPALIAHALTQGGIAGWIVERKAHPAKIGEGCKLRITEPHWPDAMIAGGQMR